MIEYFIDSSESKLFEDEKNLSQKQVFGHEIWLNKGRQASMRVKNILRNLVEKHPNGEMSIVKFS